MEISRWYAAIDAHSGGEPLRLITGGLPPIAGASQQAKSDCFRRHHDAARRLLLAEPRGHYGMTGAIVTAPEEEESRFGLLFLNHEGLAAISGHGILAAVAAWLATGQLDPAEAERGVRIDCPAGTVTAYAQCEGREVRSVSFRSVPSFVYAEQLIVEVQGREVPVDIVYSGEWYAVADSAAIGGMRSLAELRAWGGLIREAAQAQLEATGPQREAISGIHGVFLYQQDDAAADAPAYRSCAVFAGGQLDRSPGGAGACAHRTLLHHRGVLGPGQRVTYRGISGSHADCRIAEETSAGGFKAAVPQLTGTAYVLGFMHFVLDPSDPLADGFVLR